MNFKNYILIIFCIIFTQKINSQIETGIGISNFIYLGDLTPEAGSYKTIRYGINIYGGINIDNFLLRTNIAIGSLSGDEIKYNNPRFRKQRAFNFNTSVIELSQLLIWSPLKFKKFSPYLIGGIGLSFLKIKSNSTNFNIDDNNILNLISIDAAHSLPSILSVFPIGIGFKYKLSPSVAISIESVNRLLFTDYLDGFSQAANYKRGDQYQTITIGLIYYLRNKILKCPKVVPLFF